MRICTKCGGEKVRITKRWRCRVCTAACNKQWREDHPGKASELSAAWAKKSRARINAVQRVWRGKNPDKITTYKRTYRATHREAVRVAWRRFYQRHAARWNVKVRAWQAENPDKLREYQAVYNEKHPEVSVKARAVRASRLMNNYEVFTRTEIYKRDNKTCQYCGEEQKRRGWHLDHIVPLARGGNHVRENVCVSCKTCNLSKGGKLLSEWRPNLEF